MRYKTKTKTKFTNMNNENMNELLIKKGKRKCKSNLIYNKLSFQSYGGDKKYDNPSFYSKYSYLINFFDNLQKLIKMKPTILGRMKE